MASVLEARRLTEAHRLAQARLGAETVVRMETIWPLLDPLNLDATFERWMVAAQSVIDSMRTASIGVAGNYVTTFKTLELGASARTAVTIAAPLSPDAVTTSLLVTGPVSVKRAVSVGTQLAQAVDVAKANSAKAAMRHALSGGRQTIEATVANDHQSLGWARATSGKPCSFCAMLASRGPVYKGQGTANFQAHDGCSCSTEPVYRHDAAWPPGSEKWAGLWSDAKAADGPTVNEFRRLVEAV